MSAATCKAWRERTMHPCLDCPALIHKVSTRCPRCAAILRHKSRKPHGEGTCPYCETQMRLTHWREMKFWRCGGCGLEFEKPPPYMEETAA